MLASYSYTCHLLVSFEAVFDQFSGKKWSWIFFKNSFTRVYKKWLKLKSVIFLKIHIPGSKKIGSKWILIFFWKFMYPGLQKLAKNEVCDFFKNSCTRVYENWQKMKFVIILKIHVLGSMEIGQKWSLWFFQKFVYPDQWKLAKHEVWYFFENSFTGSTKNG